MVPQNLNTDDPSGHITEHFIWHEALWLPQWKRHANPSDGLGDVITAKLVVTFQKLEAIRAFFNLPINIHSGFRPVAYNSLAAVGGAPNSPHTYGEAVDWHIDSMDCDDVRNTILAAGLLTSLGLRMEKLPGSPWVHIDCRQPLSGHDRYFIP